MNKYRYGFNFENSYLNLPEIFYKTITPEPVFAPAPVVFNRSLAERLGLDADALLVDEGLEILSGNRAPDGAAMLSQAYAGHQFGQFTMLGDGRALLIGEQTAPDGKKFDIQLKGSGRTPFSRGGDGRAALGPMLREYIVSEAMQALGIPTTRSLAVVITGDDVIREKALPGAVLVRVASSHLRVGTFQFAFAGGTTADLKALADYAIVRHCPEAFKAQNPILELLNTVIDRQAFLVALWQSIGFVHGVMNTDNMAVSGETIDYGPCAFMDAYNPEIVFSSIDYYGRYAYKNQPEITKWNLARFAETLLPLLDTNEQKALVLARSALDSFDGRFVRYYLDKMRKKLGLFTEEANDFDLINRLLSVMKDSHVDYTDTFLDLTLSRNNGMMQNPDYCAWFARWQKRIKRQPQDGNAVFALMKSSNPAVIPRNHRVEDTLDKAVDGKDFNALTQFLSALADPYAHTPGQTVYADLPSPNAPPYKTFCGT